MNVYLRNPVDADPAVGTPSPEPYGHASGSAKAFLSLIVPVYNDWTALDKCLQSLSEQTNPPEFEVVVVDDSSDHVTPRYIHRWHSFYPLTIVRSPHAGVAAARNHGIRISKGAILVFTDADCQLDRHCLAELSKAVQDCEHSWFQLRLTGDRSSLVGQTEDLRLTMLQDHLLDASGRLRYLNTAGFAVRRERVDIEKGLFDPVAFRAEDTLLLSRLIQNGELPFFVLTAIIKHAIPLSLTACLRKDVRCAYLEASTFLMIASLGVRIRVSQWERLRILCSTWKASRHRRSAWWVLMCRQMLRRLTGLVWRVFNFSKLPLWSAPANRRLLLRLGGAEKKFLFGIRC